MKLRTLGLTVGLFGQILILLIFIFVLNADVFGSEGVRWLDFAVVSIVFWMWMCGVIFGPIKLKDPAQRSIGGLGIKMIGVFWYTFLALGFVVVGAALKIEFKYQIIAQGVILFFLLMMLFFSTSASVQVENVYYQEQEKKAGKKALKSAIGDLLMRAEDMNLPSEIVARIQVLRDETRFITPSSNYEAQDIDDRIADLCDRMIIAMSDYKMNASMIESQLGQVERDVKRRKSF